MDAPLICHFLIGPPGSGKSTLAAEFAKLGNYKIVSTDQIRATLYGNASIQGEWSVIQNEVLSQIKNAIASHQPVIYDATNVKRVWRMGLLMQLQGDTPPTSPDQGGNSNTPLTPSPLWMAWHLTTPLETCQAWNQQRERRVTNEVIETLFKSLQDFPPLPAEGFAAVNPVKPIDGGFDRREIQEKIHRLSRSVINRTNRTKHGKITLHRYSRLLDFDRLLHLIALIIRYPGIGALQSTAPMLLEKILGTVPNFATSLDEVCALIGKLKGDIYAGADAVAADLQWLEHNGLIGTNNIDADIEIETWVGKEDNKHSESPILHYSPHQGVNTDLGTTGKPDNSPPANLVTHAYSDIEPFKRLIKTIRFILHHPFLPNAGSGSLKTLVEALKHHQIVDGDGLDSVRKDIEKVLKPYKILPEFSLRQGYFAGTAILSDRELRKVFGVWQSQAKSLDDPVALSIYEMFRDRMIISKLGAPEVYPVRAIANRCMIDAESLPPSALSKNLETLENAIATGELLELSRFPGVGRFSGDEGGFFQAWPLQIVFYNQAWYLALECAAGNDVNLFRFERLDRLFIGWSQRKRRDREVQERSLKKLQRLHEASAGLFLGSSASDQQLFLSASKVERSKVEVAVELWFDDQMFRFVSEGTKRFPLKQMKMSPPVGRGLSYTPSKSLFSLSQTRDANFPHRFNVVLPKWSLLDVDLWRWIVGFGGKVKVVQPVELVAIVRGIGEGICRLY